MRAQEKMQNGNETAEVVFYHDNRVVVSYSNINKSISSHKFNSFDEAYTFFLQMIGALYRDGYR